MGTQHLNQYELAKRWWMSQQILEWWCWMRQGSPYPEVGYKVVYRLRDIEKYESENLHKLGERANVGDERMTLAARPKAACKVAIFQVARCA